MMFRTLDNAPSATVPGANGPGGNTVANSGGTGGSPDSEPLFPRVLGGRTVAVVALVLAVALGGLVARRAPRAFNLLARGDTLIAAHDLRLRYDEVHDWLAGREVYTEHRTAIYPPASYAMLFGLGALSLADARLAWTLLTAAAFAALAILVFRATAPAPIALGLLLAASSIAGQQLFLCASLGQVTPILLPLLIAMPLLARRRAGGRSAAWLSGALLAVVLIKPSLSAPFACLVLFSPAGLPAVAIGAGLYGLLTAVAMVVQPAPVVEVVSGWLARASAVAVNQGAPSLHSVLGLLSLGWLLVPASLAVLLGFGWWVRRNAEADPWLLIGATAAISRLWTYHYDYDGAVLILASAALFRLAFGPPRRTRPDWIALALLVITTLAGLWAKQLFADFGVPNEAFMAVRAATACMVLAFLVIRVEQGRVDPFALAPVADGAPVGSGPESAMACPQSPSATRPTADVLGRRWSRVALVVGVIVLSLVAAHRLANALHRLVSGSDHFASIDLRMRHREVEAWFAGRDVYALFPAAVYPPASYAMLAPVLRGVGEPEARLAWAAISTVALATTAWLLYLATFPARRELRWLLIAAYLAMEPLAAATSNGQVTHLQVALLLAALLIARGPSTPLHRGGVGLLWMGALIKPTVGAPFAWPLLVWAGGPAAVGAGVLGYGALTVFAARFQPGSLASLMSRWLVQGTKVAARMGAPSLHALLARLDLVQLLLPASAIVLVGLGVWVYRFRRRDPWLVVGVTACAARLWAYHLDYDNIIVIFPMIALLRLAAPSDAGARRDRLAGWLLAVLVVLMVAPGRYQLPHLIPESRLFLARAAGFLVTMGFLVWRTARPQGVGEGVAAVSPTGDAAAAGA
jgi:hypothetical protein